MKSLNLRARSADGSDRERIGDGPDRAVAGDSEGVAQAASGCGNRGDVRHQRGAGRSNSRRRGGCKFVSLPVDERGIKTERLSDDQLVAIASPRHKLAKQRTISAYTLAGERLILGERGETRGD